MEKDYFFTLLKNSKRSSLANYEVFEAFTFSNDSKFEAYCESQKALYFLFSNNNNQNMRNLFIFTSEGLEYLVFNRQTNKGSHFHKNANIGCSIQKQDIQDLIYNLKPVSFIDGEKRPDKEVLEEILNEAREKKLSPIIVNQHISYSQTLN